MTKQNETDPWDPEGYPPWAGSPLTMEQPLEDGHRKQWRLLAEHHTAGGRIDDAPRPDLKTVELRRLRPFLEGVRQARADALEMERAGIFDSREILREFAREDAAGDVEEDLQDQFYGFGHFERPADWAGARLHTTVTRLFTDDVVHDVVGEEYEPVLRHGMLVSLSGPVMLLGRGELDPGLTLEGDFRLDLIDGATNQAGSGLMCLRLLWGAEASIVGAIHCGQLEGYGKWVGIGPPGAAKQFRSDEVRLGVPGRITTVDTASGTSYWFASGPSMGSYGIYVTVDRDRTPVGVILDSSGVSSYYWYGRDDMEYAEWPLDAREFDVDRDLPGLNPNVPVDEQEDL
ncbi:hypothetical protein ACQE98_11890 [Ornithinimicrobium sp. W1679]|uniref:hypothetical protein n=1 Tax=Ornithinimicrobium sp. W1679 TaxID=3418770 RepID=UPI003CF5C4EF